MSERDLSNVQVFEYGQRPHPLSEHDEYCRRENERREFHLVESVKKLSPQPGEIVVLKVPGRLSDYEHRKATQWLKAHLPAGVEALVIGPGMEASVVSDPQIQPFSEADARRIQGLLARIRESRPSAKVNSVSPVDGHPNLVSIGFTADAVLGCDEVMVDERVRLSQIAAFKELRHPSVIIGPAAAKAAFAAGAFNHNDYPQSVEGEPVKEWQPTMDTTSREAEHSVAAIRADAKRRYWSGIAADIDQLAAKAGVMCRLQIPHATALCNTALLHWRLVCDACKCELAAGIEIGREEAANLSIDDLRSLAKDLSATQEKPHRAMSPDCAGQCTCLVSASTPDLLQDALAGAREVEGCTHGPDAVCPACRVDEVTVNENGDKVYHRHDHHAPEPKQESRLAGAFIPTFDIPVTTAPDEREKQETWRDRAIREPLL